MGAFAAENSCGASGGGSGVAVELVISIDEAPSLAIAGTHGSDAVVVTQADGSFTVASGGGGTRVVAGSPADGNCAGPADGSSVSCGGAAHKVLAAMGPGDDTVVLQGTSRSLNAVLDGGVGSDDLSGGAGADVLYAGDDRVPDALRGGGGNDVLFGVNTAHPRRDSGAASMHGGGGDDLLIGGQPCDGDFFDGGGGDNDSASFARIRNSGVFVQAVIGGSVSDPNVPGCDAGRIDGSIEKIEGSPGPDMLTGSNRGDDLLGRGGNDVIDGRGGNDSCVGGGGNDTARNCERRYSIP